MCVISYFPFRPYLNYSKFLINEQLRAAVRECQSALWYTAAPLRERESLGSRSVSSVVFHSDVAYNRDVNM